MLFFTAQFAVAQPDDRRGTTDKFESLFNKISMHYVDSVEGERLVEEAIRAMLKELDPHSIYIPREELQAMNEPLKGNFEGIGVRFQILKDTIMVVNPIPGGPSEKLGILAGDKIITVEDELIAGIGIKNNDVMDKLRGKKGTVVKVGILRKGDEDLLTFDITRDKIPIHSIQASYMAAPDVGYIKLTRFSATSMNEFDAAMEELTEAGMKDLILDLRGNGGGYLKTAVNLADEFLGGKKLIVYTEGRNSGRDDTYTRFDGSFEKGKLVVLIDESSASASEIVSGAIQDWDRGLIVGRRSFGKGLVQKPMMLTDGSAIRLTISRYYTPSGRCIQKPYEDGVDAYKKEKYERRESGELFSADSISFNDSLKYTTSRNRVVYGGGGIMPDVFVPLDTTGTSEYFNQLLRKGVFNTFALTWVDQNRTQLKKEYKQFDDYHKKFALSSKMMEEFFEYAEEEGVDRDEDGYVQAKAVIDTRLKAQIAANIWDYEKFYQIINTLSPEYNKALEAIKDNTFKKMNLAVVK